MLYRRSKIKVQLSLLRYHDRAYPIYQKNLRKMREAKGLSQEKLARLADVANNTIIKIEGEKNKNPTLDTLKKIAKTLGVSLDDLTN
jgi:transcriptional regulator with XRE-family HTH domain